MERYRGSHDDRYSSTGDSPHFRLPLPPPPRPDDLNHHHHQNRRSSPPPNLQHPAGGGFNSSPPRLPPWIRGVGDRGGGPRSSNYQVPLTGLKRAYSTCSGSPGSFLLFLNFIVIISTLSLSLHIIFEN